jgi:hypothetical protein
VGDHKTGTSSIQSTLARRQSNPEQDLSALHYSLAGRKGLMAHHNLAWALNGDNRFRKKLGTWQEVHDDLAASRPDVAILSSEGFEGFRPLADLKQAVDTWLTPLGRVEIVCYIRPHFDRLRSAYSQKMKTGQLLGDMDSFIDSMIPSSGILKYATRLRQWRAVFGDSLKTRIYSRKHLVGNDILTDFFQDCLGLDQGLVENVLSFRNNANSSPGISTLALMEGYTRELNLDDDRKKRMQMERFFLQRLHKELTGAFPDDPQPMIRRETAQKIHEAALADARDLDKNEFSHCPIFVDALDHALGAAPESVPHPTFDSSRELELHERYRAVIIAMARKHLSLLRAKKNN